MSRWKVFGLGIVSLWPIISIFIYTSALFEFPGGFSSGPPIAMILLLIFNFLSILGTIIVVAVFVMYAFDTNFVPEKYRTLWTAVLILFNGISVPLFWYVYFWSNIKKDGLPEQ